MALQENRVQIIDPIIELDGKMANLKKLTGKLIVSNLDKTKDAGQYKCTVYDGPDSSNSDTLTVEKILGEYT